MLVGVAVGYELARELATHHDQGGLTAWTSASSATPAFELSDGDTTRADRPVPDRATRRPRPRPTSSSPTHDPADARPCRPHRRHGGHRQAHGRAGGGDRRAGERDRRRRAWRRVRPQPRRDGRVRLGLGAPGAGVAHLDDAEGHGHTRPAGLVVNFGGKTVYHLGDTALFSDLALVPRRDEIDVALMCIGGHYTMDRHDAVVAAELVQAGHGDPLPLQHVPADRDRRPGLQGRRRVADQLEGRRARAGGDATRRDPRHRPDRGGAHGAARCSAASWPTSTASPRPTR